jgi:hypothetical protein
MFFGPFSTLLYDLADAQLTSSSCVVLAGAVMCGLSAGFFWSSEAAIIIG